MGSSVLGTTTSLVTRASLAGLYAAVVIGALVVPSSPALFWTVLMPLIPIGFVVVGFSAWRRFCPLAAAASFGATHQKSRRIPRVLSRRPLSASLALLAAGLWVRLVVTNGDGPALAVMLGTIAALAFLANRAWSGKSWCNALCPVGVVERIYTDAGALRDDTRSSRCAPCTGCVRACPDIDQERSYASSLTSDDRRLATFAFPGLVLAFYGYFRLREGTWDAFFDGRWTSRPPSTDLFAGPGFLFAPEVPGWAAAAVTLLAGPCVSLALFAAIERALALRLEPRAARHAALSVAACAALVTFYVFAGAPSLALVPGARPVVLLAVPLVAALVLARRLSRLRRPSGSETKRRLPVLER